jgi:hypothetical protein
MAHTSIGNVFSVRHIALFLLALIAVYVLTAYVVMPAYWKRFAAHHPAMEDAPRVTHTGDGLPGDPLNVALVGDEGHVKAIFGAAGWHPADPLGLRSDLRIAEDTIFQHPYDDAPVSRLFLFGRQEDLAFEKPVGHDPRQRHHVRWWRTEKPADDGRVVWIGAATFDERIGLSHTTGEITHHIAPDIDAERDSLFRDLQATGDLAENYFIDDFHSAHSGRNGGGDPWHSDGRLHVGIINNE